MSPRARAGAIIAVAVAILAGSFYLLRQSRRPGGPSSPPASEAPSAEKPGSTTTPPVKPPELAASVLAELDTEYKVQPGDMLLAIAGRYGLHAADVARDNHLDPQKMMIRVGQKLRIRSRHIVPETMQDGILINVPQRMLYLFQGGKLVRFYGIGPGREDWPTDLGETTVINRKRNPAWVVPRSIQAEMAAKGEPVITRMEPGPDNPLGAFWIGLGIPNLGIHGTNAPASVYDFRSHGCLRMNAADIEDLFGRVKVGLPVRIIYKPVLTARTASGEKLIEVHPDPYGKVKDLNAMVQTALNDMGVSASSAEVAALVAAADGKPIALPAASVADTNSLAKKQPE